MPNKVVYTLQDLENWGTIPTELPLRLAVLGKPISHSKSPPMHNAALEACGLLERYCRIEVSDKQLKRAFQLLKDFDFRGVNLTLPLKTIALDLVDVVDEHARLLGAINTVVVDQGILIGYNTDGPGFIKAIREKFDVAVRDLRIMILGAGGGCGRAVATQCAIEGCQQLILANRTTIKAERVAQDLANLHSAGISKCSPEQVRVLDWNNEEFAKALKNVDLLVNATCYGLSTRPTDNGAIVPAAVLHPGLMIYDTIYDPNRTKLQDEAHKAGALAASGESMLLHQGAMAFERWFKRRAPIEIMRDALADCSDNTLDSRANLLTPVELCA